jgi:hypothetical protein
MHYFGERRRVRNDNPHKVGSAAHFTAFCRTMGTRMQGVIIPEGQRIEGFIVPEDGVWMVGRRYVNPGEELTLLPGTTVTYYTTGVDHRLADDPRHRAAVSNARRDSFAAVNMRGVTRFDPLDGKMHHAAKWHPKTPGGLLAPTGLTQGRRKK